MTGLLLVLMHLKFLPPFPRTATPLASSVAFTTSICLQYMLDHCGHARSRRQSPFVPDMRRRIIFRSGSVVQDLHGPTTLKNSSEWNERPAINIVPFQSNGPNRVNTRRAGVTMLYQASYRMTRVAHQKRRDFCLRRAPSVDRCSGI